MKKRQNNQMQLFNLQVKRQEQTMLHQNSTKKLFKERISPFFLERYNDKSVNFITLVLENNQIEAKFIADNGEDFGLKPKSTQNFYDEAVLFSQTISRIDSQNEELIVEQSERQNLRNRLQRLIELLLQKFGSEDTTIIDHILNDRSIDRIYIDNIPNKQSFYKFKKILQKCHSYQQWKEHNGEDINSLKKEVKNEILGVLNNELNLEDSIQQSICEQLIENPLSTVVSNHPHLTNYQKKKFHQSPLYESDILKKYANILYFKQSRAYKAREQMSEIIDLIKRLNILIFDEMVNRLHQFRHLQLIPNQHKKIYQLIKQKQEYYHICLEVADITKNSGQEQLNTFTASLLESVRVNQILELRTKFLKLRLPFEEWKDAQISLFDSNYERALQKQGRNYGYISQLNLKNLSKIVLLSQLYSSIEPIFRSIQRPISYRSTIQQKLLGFIISNDKTFDIRLSRSIELIKETIQNRHHQQGSQAFNLRKREKLLYEEKILRDEDLMRYKENGGRDIDDEKYRRKNEVRSVVYSIHKEMDIDWPYKEIEAFIEDLVERNITSIEYIDNYKRIVVQKLQQSGNNGAIVEAIAEEVVNVEEIVERGQDYIAKYNELCDRILAKYLGSIEQSKLQVVLKDVYNNALPKMIKDIITLEAHQDEKSRFYNKMTSSNIVKKKTFKQMNEAFASFLAQQLEQAKNLLSKISQQQRARQNIGPNRDNVRSFEEMEQEFKVEATKFLQEYFKKYEESKLQLIFQRRYQRNEVNLVKDLIENRAFQDPQSIYVDSLIDFNPIIRKQIKKEFTQNTAYCQQKLQRCNVILAEMR